MSEHAGTGEKRGRARSRTRLRSGKLAGKDGAFLCDCVLHDRSPEGVRLRLADAVPVPDDLLLYDDERRDLLSGRVVWRRGREIGLRLLPPPTGPKGARIAARLASRYYAL